MEEGALPRPGLARLSIRVGTVPSLVGIIGAVRSKVHTPASRQPGQDWGQQRASRVQGTRALEVLRQTSTKADGSVKSLSSGGLRFTSRACFHASGGRHHAGSQHLTRVCSTLTQAQLCGCAQCARAVSVTSSCKHHFPQVIPEGTLTLQCQAFLPPTWA